MPEMLASRNLRLTPGGEPTGVFANLGDRVEVIETQEASTKIKLVGAFGQPVGWVSSNAVGDAPADDNPINKVNFARECWNQSLLLGVNAHYLAAVAELRSRVTSGQQGEEEGPYRLRQAEWDASRTNADFGFDYQPQDIENWRMQCAVFGLMARRACDQLIAARPAAAARPSAAELYLAQLVGAKAAAALATNPALMIDAALAGVASADLPPGGLTAAPLIQRHAALLAKAGSPVSGAAANGLIAAALQTALDAMRPLMLQTGADVLGDATEAVKQSDGSAAKLDFSTIPLERRPMAQRIVDGFAAAGYGKLQQAAALASAIGESGLDPKQVKTTPKEHSVGLFQLNMINGVGTDHTEVELKDPDTNIRLIIAKAKKRSAAFTSAGSLHDAVLAFVRDVEQPADIPGDTAKRFTKAQSLLA